MIILADMNRQNEGNCSRGICITYDVHLNGCTVLPCDISLTVCQKTNWFDACHFL